VKFTDTELIIKIRKKNHIDLFVKPKTTIKQKEKMFEKFYRSDVKKIFVQPTNKSKFSVELSATSSPQLYLFQEIKLLSPTELSFELKGEQFILSNEK